MGWTWDEKHCQFLLVWWLSKNWKVDKKFWCIWRALLLRNITGGFSSAFDALDRKTSMNSRLHSAKHYIVWSQPISIIVRDDCIINWRTPNDVTYSTNSACRNTAVQNNHWWKQLLANPSSLPHWSVEGLWKISKATRLLQQNREPMNYRVHLLEMIRSEIILLLVMQWSMCNDHIFLFPFNYFYWTDRRQCLVTRPKPILTHMMALMNNHNNDFMWHVITHTFPKINGDLSKSRWW